MVKPRVSLGGFFWGPMRGGGIWVPMTGGNLGTYGRGFWVPMGGGLGTYGGGFWVPMGPETRMWWAFELV